jgi:hypothetical protein
LLTSARRVWRAACPDGTRNFFRPRARKAPKHALDEIKADYHRVVYAKSESAAREAYAGFVAKWKKSCPSVVRSVTVEVAAHHRHHRAPQRGIPPSREDAGVTASEDSALVLLFSLVATGQIKLRRIVGYDRERTGAHPGAGPNSRTLPPFVPLVCLC